MVQNNERVLEFLKTGQETVFDTGDERKRLYRPGEPFVPSYKKQPYSGRIKENKKNT